MAIIELSSLSNKSAINLSPSIDNKDQSKIELKKTQQNVNSDDIVKSPMVGVAYLSADPTSPPYTKVGQHVKQGDTLLLIEAKKLIFCY